MSDVLRVLNQLRSAQLIEELVADTSRVLEVERFEDGQWCVSLERIEGGYEGEGRGDTLVEALEALCAARAKAQQQPAVASVTASVEIPTEELQRVAKEARKLLEWEELTHAEMRRNFGITTKELPGHIAALRAAIDALDAKLDEV